MEEEKQRLRSEQESRDRTVARRNDETVETLVKSAKERYLERKRRRLEEASLPGPAIFI